LRNTLHAVRVQLAAGARKTTTVALVGHLITWTTEELTRIGTAGDLKLTTPRRDDTLGSPRTMRVVPHGEDRYVRSMNGPTSAWYRGTRARHIRALSRR
jgi:hypothetical protein